MNEQLKQKAIALAREAAATRARQDFCTEQSNLADSQKAEGEAEAHEQREADREEAERVFEDTYNEVYAQELERLRGTVNRESGEQNIALTGSNAIPGSPGAI